jgi:hypothetical protein
MKVHGEPHAQPIALPRDARGRQRWLAFVGPPEAAWGAWRIARSDAGDIDADPVERWPAGVRVLGGIARSDAAYVLLESAGVLGQPAGLRGTWIDAAAGSSTFDASPLALAGVHDMQELATLLDRPPAPGAAERNAVALLATLRAASGGSGMLARSLAAEGVDVGVVWQSTFTKSTAHLAADEAAQAPLADHVLGIVKAAVATHACGADACEAWSDSGHAVVRFVVQGGRWVLRAVYEDAQAATAAASGSPRLVPVSAQAGPTEAVLRARARRVDAVLGEAPLDESGGTVGVGLTDLAPGIPIVVLREGASVRLFSVEAGTAVAETAEPRWDAAFADVDGDGRTDVVLHLSGQRSDGSTMTWTQAFRAPPASVQATSLEPDLPTSLATMDAADAAAGARAAVSLPAGGPSHDEACRVLTTASTAAGFRRVATADARVLLFSEPGMPTWHPKIVPVSRVGADDVRDLGAHCAQLSCSATRPYCVWTGGADSVHAWFARQGGQLVLSGAADYKGE